LDDWTNDLDQGKQIDVIYTYLEKAFDKVLHHGLLSELVILIRKLPCKKRLQHLNLYSLKYRRLSSWVIWSTSVTVESEGPFLGVFVFFEG